MMNFNKSTVESKTNELAAEGKEAVENTTDAIKSSANSLSRKVVDEVDEAQVQTKSLISSLKNLINDYTHSTNLDEMKEKIQGKVVDLKNTSVEKVSSTYYTGKKKVKAKTREKPLETIAVVAGAGLLIGYLLGSKKSNK
jgi:ElaB/YqjD/DUF883 family membrane-anchored ribosome-binding protein